MGQTNAKPLILYGSTGGLGHKYTCFLNDIGIAISGKRPIKSKEMSSLGCSLYAGSFLELYESLFHRSVWRRFALF